MDNQERLLRYIKRKKSAPKSATGPAYFDGLNIRQITELLSMGVEYNPDISWNLAPSQKDFMDFINKVGGFTLIGHLSDYGPESADLVITGVLLEGPHTNNQLRQFKKFAEGASEVTITEEKLRAWWD